MDDIVKEFHNELNALINKEDDINKLLSLWDENTKVKKFAEQRDEKLKTKIKIYLKERKWSKYIDKDSKISVSISMQKRQVVDKDQLKIMLTESQLAQVLNTTSFEKMSIITSETRKRLKKYVSKK